MKISKIIAIASAAVLMVACGTPAAEGSKEVKALLPNKAQVDSASYLIGVNFGSWIKGNNLTATSRSVAPTPAPSTPRRVRSTSRTS